MVVGQGVKDYGQAWRIIAFATQRLCSGGEVKPGPSVQLRGKSFRALNSETKTIFDIKQQGPMFFRSLDASDSSLYKQKTVSET